MADEVLVSELFDPLLWQEVPGAGALALADVTYHRARAQGTVRVAINRPEVRNAFRPRTVDELYLSWTTPASRPTWAVSCSPAMVLRSKDGGWAFSSGGDQRVRGATGYEYEGGRRKRWGGAGEARTGQTRLAGARARRSARAARTYSRCSV